MDARAVSPRRLAVAGLAATAIAVAGCGSSSRQPTSTQVTVPAYAGFPPDTISVPTNEPDSPTCRLDAKSFARTSLVFLAYAGPKSAYPPDAYYLVMREELADFGARRCDLTLLGNALRRLTPKQRSTLLSLLPRVMVDVLRRSLASTG